MADPNAYLQYLASIDDEAVRVRDSVSVPPDFVISHACRASEEYFGAERDESFRILRLIERAPYSKRAEAEAWSNLEAAREQLRVLELVGPDLRLHSEWLRAQAMVERYEMISNEFALKLSWLTDAKKSGRLKRKPITDGHFKTGKFELIDGVRVPIVEEIE